MLNCHCREHLIFVMLFFTLASRLAFIALLSLSVAVQAHQLTSGQGSGRYFFIMSYLNFTLVDNKVSRSVEITSWIRYVDNIHTLSENIKFIYVYVRALET